MVPGTHGSTFGGNPLAMAVAEAAFDIIAEPAFLETVTATAEVLRNGIEAIGARHASVVREIRGKGMLLGVALHSNNRAFMAAARDHRLLIAGGGDNIVRLLPPLNVTASEIEAVLERFTATCEAMTVRKAS
jgi:acetylornithine/N-succinyldiaminopimelate aminotransferase